MNIVDGRVQLENHVKMLIEACKKVAYDGTVLFTPDGVGNYDALWTRDFAYMVEYCSDLMDPVEIRGCIDYIIRGHRKDGWMPDRMEAGGDAVYAAGAKGSPLGKANLDNTPFLIFAVDRYLHLLSTEESKTLFSIWAGFLDRGMDCIPLGENGLVWNDPNDPHSPYGFTDTVCKTGHLFIESILYWKACRKMGSLHQLYGSSDSAGLYRIRSERIEKSLLILFDEQTGAFLLRMKIAGRLMSGGCYICWMWNFRLICAFRDSLRIGLWIIGNAFYIKGRFVSFRMALPGRSF